MHEKTDEGPDDIQRGTADTGLHEKTDEEDPGDIDKGDADKGLHDGKGGGQMYREKDNESRRRQDMTLSIPEQVNKSNSIKDAENVGSPSKIFYQIIAGHVNVEHINDDESSLDSSCHGSSGKGTKEPTEDAYIAETEDEEDRIASPIRLPDNLGTLRQSKSNALRKMQSHEWERTGSETDHEYTKDAYSSDSEWVVSEGDETSSSQSCDSDQESIHCQQEVQKPCRKTDDRFGDPVFRGSSSNDPHQEAHETSYSQSCDSDQGSNHCKPKVDKPCRKTDGKICDPVSSMSSSDPHQDAEIHIKYYKQKQKGVRDYSKLNCCLYCGKLLEVVIARHYFSQHSDRPAVAQILALNNDSEENRERRDKLLKLLRYKGNFYHNEKVRQTGVGEIIPVRRPPHGSDNLVDDYGACPQCLGYFLKTDLWRHAKYRCIAQNKYTEGSNVSRRKGIQLESSILMGKHMSEKGTDMYFLEKMVLSTMHDDDILNIVQNDPLILELGCQVLRRQYDRKTQSSEKMRLAGRILRQLRILDPEGGKTMNDFIKPSKFDLMVQAVEEVAGQIEDADDLTGGELDNPSTAIKAGNDMGWLARIKRGKAIRHYDGTIDSNISEVEEKEASKFLDLIESEWKVKISSNAHRTLHDRRCKKKVKVPKTADLQKVAKYLTNEVTCSVQKIKNIMKDQANNGESMDVDYASYRRLQKVVEVRLLLFNKRRPREVSKITVDRIDDHHETQIDEFAEHLSSLEKKLIENLEVVKISGKRGRFVPLIIPPECQEGLRLILSLRKNFIPPSNVYVFARRTHSTYMNAGQILTKILRELKDLESPDDVRATKLRKYTATVIQMLSLKQYQLEWVAEHLGHNIDIHKDFYRVQEANVELCKVSRLLLAIDAGDMGRWVGKSLDDIDVGDIVYPGN